MSKCLMSFTRQECKKGTQPTFQEDIANFNVDQNKVNIVEMK